VLRYNQICIASRCRDNGPQIYWGHDIDLSESLDVVSHVTNRISMGHFLLVVHWNQVYISSRFWDTGPSAYWDHDLDLSRSRDVIGHVTIWFPGSHFLYGAPLTSRISSRCRDNGPQIYWGGVDLSGSRDIISHVTIRIPIGHLLLVVYWIQVSISNGFRDIMPQTSCAHRHNARSSLRMRDIMWHVSLCKI